MKKGYFFSKKDIEQITSMGISNPDVERQLAIYSQGPRYLHLDRPCTVGDGIRAVSSSQRKKLIQYYDSQADQCKILKFVPASGAASRMFADWFAAAEKGSFGSAGLDRSFFADLNKMPFISILHNEKSAHQSIRQKNIGAILDYILLPNGLRFGWLPKALIPFHAYRNGEVRTAFEEHFGEAASFTTGTGRVCRLHFTVSDEHVRDVKALMKLIIPLYEKRCQVRFRVNLSVQSPATNILAVDEKNLPFRDETGSLVFRPGGHGALIQNLQNMDADMIFIKNIDNIVPDILQKKILPYKKMLGGLALQLRKTVITMLRQLEKGQLTVDELEAITDFCRMELSKRFSKDFSKLSPQEKQRQLFLHLNRPLRICGMVRNEGEPGGAPFWVREKDNSQTLQIVESSHVDPNRPSQKNIWSRASYFNPVDMVCCTKNHCGKKFNLADYVNRDAYLIIPKTEKGRHLKAQEMPGLWNGGMAYWNTVFVELPVIVFNPVKTVYDLLRPQHRGGRAIK
ncbi:MAG: DUF4301 family protein [Smithella sp.]|jgi:hypothetical protein